MTAQQTCTQAILRVHAYHGCELPNSQRLLLRREDLPLYVLSLNTYPARPI